MADEAVDVTEKCQVDGAKVMLSGDDMRLFGSSARSDVDKDKAEPSFLVKIVK